MKRLVAFLCLMMVVLPGMAQNQSADMPFSISFSAISNSPPPDSGFSGLAGYYRTTQPFLPGMPTYTNLLKIVIGLPVPVEDGWILELQEDGSFTPVVELTNPIDGYIYENVTLTTNQVHGLIAGDFYVEVDFSDATYLGNLAPQYAFAKGPTARMIFPTPIGENTAWGYTAISRNNRTATVVLDGSNCTDPFYLPIQYSWTGYAGYFWDPTKIVFTDTNVMTTNVFNIGVYSIALQVSDIIATNQPYGFSLQVVTAGQALNSFISILNTAAIPENRKRVLIKVLSDAARSFDKGNMLLGCARLEVYVRLVEAYHFDSTFTSNLLRPVQDVMAAFKFPNRGFKGGSIGLR